MIKKILLGLSLVLVLVLVGYLNAHHFLRIKNDLPPFTHSEGEYFVEQVVMQDGIKLNTRIRLPAGQDAWPVVLMRNPYPMLDKLLTPTCKMFVRYGYGCVIQHTRGQGESEGEWEPLVNEPKDGSQTLYWLAEQEWVDGNIGMWGVSYLALVQWAAAFDYPPELKTIVPISMGTDFHKTLFENGTFRHFVTWWMMVIPDSDPDIANASEDRFLEATRHMPHTEVDDIYTEQDLGWYNLWMSSTNKSAPIWERWDAVKLSQVAQNLDIPVLIFDGWYDPFFGSLFQDYLDLGSRDKSVMVIGPWNHLQETAGDLLPDDTQDAGSMSMQMSLQWFDYHLRGNKSEDWDESYIKIYDMGATEWQQFDTWPPQTEMLRFYLSGFEASKNCEGGSLAQDAGDVLESVSYTFDPENPVMTQGGAGFIMPVSDEIGPGALIQGRDCERDDVLSFVSEPLDQDVTIAGEVSVYLKVSSDADDTMFTAKLLDVQPNGDAVNIRDSATTLTLRNGFTSPVTYIPESQVNVKIDMWTIYWTLKAGNRLRLDVSSSNFPAFNLHSNYAGPWHTQTKRRSAEQMVYSPGSLDLPVRVISLE